MSTDIKSETLTGTADTSLATSAQVSPLIASGRPETSSSQHDERRVPSHPARPQRPRRWAWIGLIGLLGCVAAATGWLFRWNANSDTGPRLTHRVPRPD